jgi:PTS system nitrogen regulatory IIA component
MQLSVRDAAQLLNASERAIYRWIKERALPHHRVQEQLRFNRVELFKWATREGIPFSPDVFNEARGGTPAPTLAQALEAGGVHHGIRGADKREVIRALVPLLRLPPDVDPEFVCAALMARENVGSTSLGGGIAIPHPRNPVVLPLKSPRIALAFIEEPVDFGAPDGKPVFALFALFSPTVRVHLHLLARLTYLIRDEKVRRVLERRAPADEVLAVVRAQEAALEPSRGGGAGAAPPG